MRRTLQAVPLVLCGLGLLHVSLVTDLYLRYVKEGMRPLLIATGAVLLLLGLASALLDRGANSSDGHGHGHSGTPKVAWLLLVPALSLLCYAPPALGAYTAARQSRSPSSTRATSDRCRAPRPCP